MECWCEAAGTQAESADRRPPAPGLRLEQRPHPQPFRPRLDGRRVTAPARGSYVEVCRGPHRIVARVVWAEQDRFGARARDAIAVDAIARDEAAPPPAAANFGQERRSARREETPADRHERNRLWSRRLEFACVVACGFLAAFFAFDTVWVTLSKPLHMIEAKLGGKG